MSSRKAPILVAACLLGAKCRYDGKPKRNKKLIKALEDKPFVAVCPEQLGGLATPRPRNYFVGGDGKAVLEGKARIKNAEAKDTTDNFIRGAKEVLQLAQTTGAKVMIGVEKSPSCGMTLVDREGKWIRGEGVTTALLRKNGIEVRDKI